MYWRLERQVLVQSTVTDVRTTGSFLGVAHVLHFLENRTHLAGYAIVTAEQPALTTGSRCLTGSHFIVNVILVIHEACTGPFLVQGLSTHHVLSARSTRQGSVAVSPAGLEVHLFVGQRPFVENQVIPRFPIDDILTTHPADHPHL